MGIEENKQLVDRFMRLFSEQRIDEAFALIDDDAVWSMWGSGPAARDYSKAEMKALLLQSQQWFDGIITWLPTHLVAEEDRVAVESRSNGHTHGGYRHQNSYHNLFRVKDGRITEIREMFQEGRVRMLFKQLQTEAAPGQLA